MPPLLNSAATGSEGGSKQGPTESSPVNYSGILIVFLCVLIIDQLTKILAMHFLVLGHSRPVLPGLFDFTLVFNPGAAFGMFGGLPDTQRRVALATVSVIALVVVFRFMFREARHDNPSQLALSAILAGAVGNIIDRFKFDAVVDFLDCYYGNYHWPAFNIADSAISIGVVVLIFRMLFFKPPQPPVAAQEQVKK